MLVARRVAGEHRRCVWACCRHRANLDPISGALPGEPPFAAAIFLHRNSYSASGASRPTSGCVSLAEDDLEFALRLIDPGLSVQFAIGELSWLRDSA